MCCRMSARGGRDSTIDLKKKPPQSGGRAELRRSTKTGRYARPDSPWSAASSDLIRERLRERDLGLVASVAGIEDLGADAGQALRRRFSLAVAGRVSLGLR